uniref:Ubiquitin carboxyl-terminal hydrolase 47 n=1 Tax=Haemonchus contortus TaxID=6289 RepID=A0A7I4Y354_HAECO
MVLVPGDPQPSSSSSCDIESSPSSPGVQFNSSSCGLPGGDMHHGRATNTLDKDRVQEDADTLTSEEQSDAPISKPAAIMYGDVPRQVPLDENGHKYVGLINQAMTCYLNSLVQSLYMTPEFRNAIYKWEYHSSGKSGNIGEREARSIPYQIQKLFLLLQTSDLGSLETKDLTASFGWSSNEAYDQHDVQELCRLMFDALELKWKGTQNEKLIQNLYRGKLQDFVKCLKCGKESLRSDVFLDLPLAVKPFGAVEAFRSVEEALRAFVTPELLDGSNQYFCERCNSKQDAHKGLRVTEFPYLLTIQLKRFDFDYNTMHRIKLNDRMTFPDVLDLNPFVYSPNAPQLSDEELLPASTGTGSETVIAGQPLDRSYVNKLLKRGEYVYELFSVMVHQGSAAGGHYFAYIKNMDQDRWYCFNDTRVEPVGFEEIAKSFGGTYGGWSTSNTNAYMLMYRKISKVNSSFIRTADLPQHITQLKSQWKEQEAERERQRIYQLNLVNIKVHLNMVSDNESLLREPYVVDMPRTQVLCDVYNQALKFFEEKSRSSNHSNNPVIFRHHSRLIRATSERGLTIYEAYVSRADLAKKIETCLVPGRPNNLMFLFDVWRPRGIPYPVFPPNGRTIRVARVDIVSRLIYPFFYVYVNPDLRSVIQVKQLIGSMFGDGQRAAVASRLVLERDSQANGLVLLDSPAMNFADVLQQCFSGVPLLYCDSGTKGSSEVKVEEDRRKPLNESIMFAVLDRKKFAQVLLIELPPQEEITRAQVASHAYSGSAWMEVTSASKPSPKSPSSTTFPPMPATPLNGASCSSSHVSSVTGGESNDELEGSCCQNTPQISPNVSDVDDGVDDSSTSSFASFVKGSDAEELLEASAEASSIPESSDTLVPIQNPPLPCSSRSIIELDSSTGNLLYLDVDSRLPFGRLKNWLGRKLLIDPTQFVLMKHYREDDKGYECNNKDEENIRSALDNVFKLGVKLRPPLKEDEKLIRIVQFDLEEPNRENWKVLFECPASKQTSIGDLLRHCIHLYAEIYGQRLTLNQVRLREMPSFSRPMKVVLNLGDTLESRGAQWSNNIYFQVISDERLIGQPGVPILVRRFRPSTVEVTSIHEVLVDPNATDQMHSFASSVSFVSGIPIDRLVFTEVGSSWEKWPFALSRLAMLDGVVRFSARPSYAPNDVIERIGGRVVYYKDAAEVSKELSNEDRKQIQIRENGQSQAAVARRKERPLRIQMSSISEP